MVSVVIPCLKPPIKVLKDLDKQTYKEFEVICAYEKGIVRAMNNALEKAKGDIFVRIDDDVALPERWLEELIRPFKSVMVGGATGPTFIPEPLRKNRDSIRMAENPKGILKWLYDNNEFKPAGIRKCGCVSYDSNYEERFVGRFLCVHECDHLEGTNWAMRTELIKKVGGFDVSFDGVCEWFDTDVVYKVKDLGHIMAYNPKAYLYHLVEKGPAYHERFEGWGRIKNFIRFHRRHTELNGKMQIYLLGWMGYFLCKRLFR